MNNLHLSPYRFDTGPSLFTMPELVKELFDLAGYDINDFFKYQKLNETCRYFFEDKTKQVQTHKHLKLILDVFQKKTLNFRNCFGCVWNCCEND